MEGGQSWADDEHKEEGSGGRWECALLLSPVAGPEPAGSGEAQLGGGRAQGWQVGVDTPQREGAMAVIYRTLTHGHDGTMLIWWSRSPNKVAVWASARARPVQPILTLTTALRGATPHGRAGGLGGGPIWVCGRACEAPGSSHLPASPGPSQKLLPSPHILHFSVVILVSLCLSLGI